MNKRDELEKRLDIIDARQSVQRLLSLVILLLLVTDLGLSFKFTDFSFGGSVHQPRAEAESNGGDLDQDEDK